MATQRIDFDELKSRFDLRDYVEGAIGAPSKRTSQYWLWCSPLRSERTPSFAVWHDHFYDFGNGQNGSIIDFVMEYEGCDFKEAVERLGGNVPASKPKIRPAAVSEPPKRKITFETVQQAFLRIEEGLPFFHKRCISTPASYQNYLGVKEKHYTSYVDTNGVKYTFAAKRYAVPNIFNGDVRAINYRRDDAALIEAFWSHPESIDVYDDIAAKLGHQPTDEEVVEAIGGRKYEQELGSKWRPFNVSTLVEVIEGKPKARETLPYVLVHAETKEYDTLALADHGYPTVGITLNSEIETSLPGMFAKVPFVYVIRDRDPIGLTKAQKLVRAIGRGRIITPLNEFKDSGEIVQANLLDTWLFKSYGLEPLVNR